MKCFIGIDLGSTTMHYNGSHTNTGKQGYIAKNRLAQMFIHHGGTAVFDNHPAATKTLDERQCFTKNLHP